MLLPTISAPHTRVQVCDPGFAIQPFAQAPGKAAEEDPSTWASASPYGRARRSFGLLASPWTNPRPVAISKWVGKKRSTPLPIVIILSFKRINKSLKLTEIPDYCVRGIQFVFVWTDNTEAVESTASPFVKVPCRHRYERKPKCMRELQKVHGKCAIWMPKFLLLK